MQGEAAYSNKPLSGGKPRDELVGALQACRRALAAVALLSGMSNVLMLTAAFFMLEVYDRVLPSRSMATLSGLALLAAILYVFLGTIDLIRGRLMTRVGQWTDETLSDRLYEVIVRLPLKIGNANDGMQPLRDLDQLRSFLTGAGPIALFDLPWIPLYLGICFVLHFWIGITALIGAGILLSLAIFTEFAVRQPTREASELGARRRVLAETGRRNADVIVALGMAGRLRSRWTEVNARHLDLQKKASDLASGLGAISRMFRLMLQSGVLAVGAYLVVHGQATAGIIIAGSILAARALAPVDLAIANWRSFVAARQSWRRLSRLLALLPRQADPMALPPPTRTVTVEGATVMPPGGLKLVLQDINLGLKAGDGLAIIGPSASGKSSLAKLLVGAWQPARGRVRIDSAALSHWSAERLGAHIGYLPQEVELIDGSVAENISRFDPNADPAAIVAAAQSAGAHPLIAGLDDGYDTRVGEQGAALSAGQRQWIGLARALYRDPFLVVLDEPNSNLDASGEEALARAIQGVRRRGGIAVVVAHRPGVLASLDTVLVLDHGRIQASGPRDEVLAQVLRTPVVGRPLRVVPDAGSLAS